MNTSNLESLLNNAFLIDLEKLPRKEDVSSFAETSLTRSLLQIESWLDDLPDNVRTLFLTHTSSKNTLKSYKSDLVIFFEWCLVNHKSPLPCDPVDLLEFCLDQDSKGFVVSTIKRRISSVSWLHRKAGFLGSRNPRETPFFKEGIYNLKRQRRDARSKRPEELTTEVVRAMVVLTKEEKNQLLGTRNRAMILLGFSSALRRSDLVKITVDDIKMVIEGMEIYIPFSKTDQSGRGHIVRIARGQVPITCPVQALTEWIKLSDVRSGPLFRSVTKGGKVRDVELSPITVSRMIKKYASRLELENPGRYSAHSLRSGFASTAALNGASIQAIKTQGNWKSDDSLMRYIRNRENWESAASYKLGL